jgi:protein ImuA
MVAQQAFAEFFDASAPAADALDALHADVWRAHVLALAPQRTVATGEALLDLHLPGGGWPVGALTELLQSPGVHNEWRLLAPALARCGTGPVVLVAPPHLPFVPALAAQGLAARRLLWFKLPPGGAPAGKGGGNPSASATPLWATEQALRCAPVDAVLAWLPQARTEQLRRLHLAAAEHHKLLFVMRSDQARQDASPAVLRLQLSSDADGGLCLELLKRRGPPLEHSLHLAARTPALRQLLAVADMAQPAVVAQAAPPSAARVRALVPTQATSRTRRRVAGSGL